MEGLTLRELLIYLTEIAQKNPENEDLPVMLVENIYKKGTIEPTIRHMTKDDITLEKNLNLTGNIVYSQFDSGLVLGFITIVE